MEGAAHTFLSTTNYSEQLDLEALYNNRPSCGPSCIFSSDRFLAQLDIIGLKTPPRTNFSPEFLALRSDLCVRQPPRSNESSPTNDTKTKLAAQIYTKLDSEHIRLLRLLPGAFTDSLECELVDHKFENSLTTYHAISYTWGKPVFPARLLCHGIAVPITQNLSDALHFLRDEKTSRLFWIDALCINQTDLDEVSFPFLAL